MHLKKLTDAAKRSIFGIWAILMLAILAPGAARRGQLGIVLAAAAVLLIFEVASRYWMAKRMKQIQIEADEFANELASMSLEEAREKAFAALATNTSLVAHPATSPDGMRPELCSSVREIFSRYRSIEFEYDTLVLGEHSSAYTIVGDGVDGCHLVVRNHDQILIETESFPPSEADLANSYPSIYHWIAIRIKT